MFVRSFQTGGPQWVAAVITRYRGPPFYDFELADGSCSLPHDHIQTQTVSASPSIPEESSLPLSLPEPPSEAPVPNSTTADCSEPSLHRSSRTRRPPNHYTELD